MKTVVCVVVLALAAVTAPASASPHGTFT